MMRYLLLLLLLFVSCPVSVDHLRCEMLTNPEGIDVLTPRLSWEINATGNNIKQTAYQVIVASSIEKLNEGDLWNSGKVLSDQSIHITYAGKPLKSGTDCYWKVKVWTTAGVSDWSTPAHWSMGLFNWQAHWIGLDSAFAWDSAQSKFSRLSARYCRKSFDVKSGIKKATVYMAGLGHYELYINGKQQRDVVLAQAPTDYSKNILYNTYDVTNIIKQGKNVIGTVLGNGRFFTMRQAYKPYKIKTFGYPKLLLQLDIEYTNGEKQSIITDDSWKITTDGPIRTNNEYDGEEYDATKEMPGWDNIAFNDDHWLKAALVQSPGGRLEAQMNEPVKVMEKIKPVSIRAVTPGVYIMDMGQNMVGWLRMKVTGQRGQQVTLRYAETLKPNGALYTENLRDAKVTDRYTLKGGGKEIWAPSFVYHGFRYVEITGCVPALDDFVGEVVYDNLTTTGQFETSDPTLNQIYKNAYWGIRGNYKGMPVDCPQRNERMPWLGDRATGAYGESFLFDNAKLYAKWLDDIEYAQTPEGAIPDVAPAYWNYYSDNMTWPGTYLLIANTLYEQFGDVQSIRKHYPSMKKWMEYMRSKYLVNNIMTKDKYGDWCVPPESKELIHAKDSSRLTSGTLIATAYYYHLLTLMQHFAGLVHEDKDAKAFADLSVKVKTAFNQRFLSNQHDNSSTVKYYDNNTVTANLLPLSFNMVPVADRKEIFEQIVRKSDGHISTGMIGIQWLMRGLTDNGRPDLAYEIAASRDYPGWGYMVANGATTIWELWNGNTANPGMNSHNHVMLLGDLLVWYYEDLAGIKSHDAFKDIIMKPVLLNGLDEVNASFHCMYGDIRSHWKKTPGSFTWDISVPANTTATVYIPAKSVKDVKGHGTFLRMEQDRAVYKVGSGDYTFIAEQTKKKAVIVDEFIFDKAPFPESHAATIAETPKGLITAWFGGTKERNPDVGIWVSRQVKDTISGQSNKGVKIKDKANGQVRLIWTPPVEVANGIVSDSVRYACWNPVLYQVPGGDLLLFYKTGPNVAGWKGWMKTSADGGMTWSAAQALPQGFLGPIKNKPVLLDSTLLCPSSTEEGGWKVHFEATKDNGKTWTMTGPINDGKTSNAIQPSILSYGNGKLQVLCRSKERVIEQSWSTDNGRSWSPVTATSLPNNNSGTDAVTLSDGRQLLVYNHVKTPEGASKGARTPLNVAVSKDGITWYAALVLEGSPIGQYSYPSVIQSADGYVHIVYTWRRQKIKYVKIDPRQLTLKLIKNEQWTDVNL